MKKQTILEKYRARFEEIKTNYNDRMAKMQGIIDAARNRIATAQGDLQDAIDREDTKAYQLAQSRINESQSIIAMYTTKKEQEQGKVKASPEESAEMLADLRRYKNELGDEYDRKIDEIITELEKIHTDYISEISACKDLLTAWNDSVSSLSFDKSYYGSQTARKIDHILKNYNGWKQYAQI